MSTTDAGAAGFVGFVRAGVCAVVVALAAVQGPVARAQSNGEQPVFRTGTRLVQVDVVVRAKNGPVADLTEDDFRVTDNGRTQRIAVFTRHVANPEGPKHTALPTGMVTNRPVSLGVDPVSATVILIDRNNTPIEDQGYAREQALKYLRRAGRRELIAIYSVNLTLDVLQPFTDDRDALYAAVDRSFMQQSPNLLTGQTGLLDGLTDNAAMATIANANQRRADVTTAVFATIARQLKGLPGRKKLVWITAGLPLTFYQNTTRNTAALQEYHNVSGPLFAVTKVLNDANVAVYPIDPRGVFPGVLSDPNITSMLRMAEMTGGRAFYANNDLSAAIDEAVTDTDVTYTLGFYPTEDAEDGSFHSIAVRVARPGVETRYRRGYSAGVPQKAMTKKQRGQTLSAWVEEPLEATAIQIRVQVRRVANRPGQFAVQAVIDPADLELVEQDGVWTGAFDVAIVPDVRNPPLGLRETFRVQLAGAGLIRARSEGVVVNKAVTMTNGKGKPLSDKVKVVVMDQANGKAGSVRVPLEWGAPARVASGAAR